MTCYGVAEHLDHLVDLGVTAIYLNPIFSSASNHRYHTFDYLAVDPLLGGDAALRELLDAAHARGIRVVLDAVFNHASRGLLAVPPRHGDRASTRRIATGSTSIPRTSRRAARCAPTPASPSRTRSTRSGARPIDEGQESLTTLGYRAWWDLPALPKLNTDNPIVREYLMGVAEHWMRFGIDGWRLDVPHEITAPGFWEEFRAARPGRQPRGVHRRRDLAGARRPPRRAHVRRPHALPAGQRGHLRGSRRRTSTVGSWRSTRRSSARHSQTDGAGFLARGRARRPAATPRPSRGRC